MEISLPDENGRLQILQIHTNKMKENSFLAPDVNLQELGMLIMLFIMSLIIFVSKLDFGLKNYTYAVYYWFFVVYPWMYAILYFPNAKYDGLHVTYQKKKYDGLHVLLKLSIL